MACMIVWSISRIATIRDPKAIDPSDREEARPNAFMVAFFGRPVPSFIRGP